MLGGQILMSNIKPYNVEVVEVKDGDVILLHLATNLDLDEIKSIRQEIQKQFPNNIILCANELILDRITVFKKEENPFDITTGGTDGFNFLY
jgi:hypothetical protein